MERGYEFDDVLIVPKNSHVNSREDVDTSVTFGDLKLRIPIIGAPMKGITSIPLIQALDKLGGIGIQHRFFCDDDEWKRQISFLELLCYNWGVAVGPKEVDRAIYAIVHGAKIICIDVANGYIDSVKDAVSYIADKTFNLYSNTLLMAGNVATPDGVAKLVDAGADMVRVGIGGGALCTTRNVTGIGVPQLTAIMNCARGIERGYIIADGGIRNSGDIVKALAAGADAVMIGTMFAKAYESDNNGIIYGGASQKLQEEYYHNTKSIEGIEKAEEKVAPLQSIIDQLVWGIRSAMTYLNARTLIDLTSAEFIEVGCGSIKKL